jgi:hypothetical protein
MSSDHPTTVTEMIRWLRAHPEEPFFTIYRAKRLIVGTRNDEGELHAYDCTVRDEAVERDNLAQAPEGLPRRVTSREQP